MYKIATKDELVLIKTKISELYNSKDKRYESLFLIGSDNINMTGVNRIHYVIYDNNILTGYISFTKDNNILRDVTIVSFIDDTNILMTSHLFEIYFKYKQQYNDLIIEFKCLANTLAEKYFDKICKRYFVFEKIETRIVVFVVQDLKRNLTDGPVSQEKVDWYRIKYLDKNNA